MTQSFAITDEPSATLAAAQALLEKKRPTEAAALLERRIVEMPGRAELRLALGTALMELAEHGRAAAVLLKATRLDPALLAPRLLLAKALSAQGRHADALSILTQTSAAFPDTPEVWAALGALQRALDRPVDAEASFRRQLALTPKDATALNNLGVALRAQNRIPEAIDCYQQALTLAPDHGPTHVNLGNAFDAAGRTVEAATHLRRAAALTPTDIDARYNLGAHLVREEQAAEAIEHLRFVVATDAKRWDAWTNLGVALVALNETSEAERCYRAALALRPSPEAHYNLAWLLLLTGRWAEGWREYEWRWQLPNFSSIKRHGNAPARTGEPTKGTIVLHAEQGMGDTIQFVRLAAEVRRRCARVVLECHLSLVKLLRGAPGIDEVVPFGAHLPPHEAYAYLLSLPGLLGLTPDNIPVAEGYLSAAAVPKNKRPRIGVVWAGSPDNKIDRRRSCDPALFTELMDGLDVEVIDLQLKPGETKDWADTAAEVASLDLVIGVDTGVMHLAGALGRPAWILLPFAPDFRWLLGRDDSPWYASARLFRQTAPGDWPGLFAQVRTALTHWLQRAANLDLGAVCRPW